MADKRKNEGKLKAVKGPKLPKFSEEEMPKLAPGRFNMTLSSKEYREKFLLAKETAEEVA